MRPDVVPGATLPDDGLVDHLGRSRRRSEIQGSGPIAVMPSSGMTIG